MRTQASRTNGPRAVDHLNSTQTGVRRNRTSQSHKDKVNVPVAVMARVYDRERNLSARVPMLLDLSPSD
jgi:hypothetical protein